ncbi:MAG: hypothetical protein FRX49_11250 [Trebouxia sp. A1-2]|nr:MAG: hypothetical protein FRX49_11250 [Trebouxia sp. A1-2]
MFFQQQRHAHKDPTHLNSHNAAGSEIYIWRFLWGEEGEEQGKEGEKGGKKDGEGVLLEGRQPRGQGRGCRGQGDGDRQGEALRHCYHHNGDSKDEEVERTFYNLVHRETFVLNHPPTQAQNQSLCTVAVAVAVAIAVAVAVAVAVTVTVTVIYMIQQKDRLAIGCCQQNSDGKQHCGRQTQQRKACRKPKALYLIVKDNEALLDLPVRTAKQGDRFAAP